MSVNELRNVNFGCSKGFATGSTGVGYRLLDVTGSVVLSRTTGSVYELESGSGIYAAYVPFPDDFQGSILWDTGTYFSRQYFATEEYNPDPLSGSIANIEGSVTNISSSVSNIESTVNDISVTLNVVSASVEYIRALHGGRWKILTGSSQMVFYAEDNVTEVARFDLFDADGNPSTDCVFERVKV